MDILDCAASLDTLDLSLDLSYALTSRVSSTFATFKVLRNLTLTDSGMLAGEKSWTDYALDALRSPLVTLCIRDKRYLGLCFQHPGESFQPKLLSLFDFIHSYNSPSGLYPDI